MYTCGYLFGKGVLDWSVAVVFLCGFGYAAKGVVLEANKGGSDAVSKQDGE